jgi:MFS family permease
LPGPSTSEGRFAEMSETPMTQASQSLIADGWILFTTRFLRLFAYGLLSVILVLYLVEIGLTDVQVGLLLTLTLLGDTAITLWLTTTADRLGRRRMLMASALLMVFSAVLFAVTDNFWLLLVAATIGVISPSGNEVGPFLPIEQSSLAQTLSKDRRTSIFAWYSLVGSLATAWGALVSGLLTQLLQDAGLLGASLYQPLLIVYGVIGLILIGLFALLSPAIEIRQPNPNASHAVAAKSILGLHRSRRIVLRLSALFALDAFGGGFVIQSVVVYWFHIRFGVEPIVLGSIFFGANLLAGFSALAAGWLAKRFGLINTMVFTHLPSNVLLILVPLMPNLPWAIALLLLRFSISQMDVPARQSYTMTVVHPDERSAASGITGVARSLGAAISPSLATLLVNNPTLMGMPFILAGGIKIAYDLLLYRSFIAHRVPEESYG